MRAPWAVSFAAEIVAHAPGSIEAARVPPHLRYAGARSGHAHALSGRDSPPCSLSLPPVREILRDVPARVSALRAPGAGVHAAPGAARRRRVPARDVGGPVHRRE